MRVSVTQDDIDNGIPNHNFRCPIGNALNRTYYGEFRVGKNNIQCLLPLSGSLHYYALPGKAIAFIECFDAGQPDAQPFIFEMESVDAPKKKATA